MEVNKTATEAAEKDAATPIEIVLGSENAVRGFVQGLEFSKDILETQVNNMASIIRKQNLDADSMETVKLNKGYHEALKDVLSNVGTPIAEEILKHKSPVP